MSEENRKKEETMEEPTREMEKETGAETDLPETEPAAEQEEAKKAAEAKEAEAAEETAEDGKERKFFKKKKDKKDEKIEELTDRLTRQMAEFDNFRKRTEKEIIMALGNVFIKDVDGNIPYDTGSSARSSFSACSVRGLNISKITCLYSDIAMLN